MAVRFINQKAFASTQLRKDALKILKAGLTSVSADYAIQTRVHLNGDVLCIGRKKYNLKKYRNIYVIGIGKMSFDAARVLEKLLGSWITDGIVIDVKKGSLKKIRSFVGTHPFPSQTNIKVTEKILKMLESVDSDDLVISIISGGGSALFCKPYKMTCEELSQITSVLMKQGANIHEMNTIRKHLSEVLGGNLARLVYPATLASLIFSDVPGDDISMVASGPTVLDKTSVKDARRVMKKYNVISLCDLKKVDFSETSKDSKYFLRVHNELVTNNVVAVRGMAEKAKELGYRPFVHSTTISGEASNIGALLAGLVKPGMALIAAGETVVNVKGKGKGGRNQEAALGALSTLPSHALFVSFNSDGRDHCDVAGGCVDDIVKDVVHKKKLNTKFYLEENNSYAFFKKTGSFIKTGVTGLNVSDLILVLQK